MAAPNGNKYITIQLRMINMETMLVARKSLSRHVLVANRFCKKRGPECRFVDHYNKCKGDDIYTNLRWLTPAENSDPNAPRPPC